jgi:hypothetical protein
LNLCQQLKKMKQQDPRDGDGEILRVWACNDATKIVAELQKQMMPTQNQKCILRASRIVPSWRSGPWSCSRPEWTPIESMCNTVTETI